MPVLSLVTVGRKVLLVWLGLLENVRIDANFPPNLVIICHYYLSPIE